MRFQSTKIPVIFVLAILGSARAESAFAALELRDINGRPTANSADAEFAYDTVLDATWYLTANDIRFQWDDAKSWAAGLTVGTFSGWSLPAADPSCGNPYGSPYNCTGSQMGELWYTALGNTGGVAMSNTGPFRNLQSRHYWTGTEFAPNTARLAWLFDTNQGAQDATFKEGPYYALAVRPGDVAAVPEPGKVALLLSGLAGMMVMRRKRADAGIPSNGALAQSQIRFMLSGLTIRRPTVHGSVVLQM